MATENETKETVRTLVTDQQVKLPTSGSEVRKGVNVLNTSSPENPAPNPFVQNQAKPQEKSQSSSNNSNQNTGSKE